MQNSIYRIPFMCLPLLMFTGTLVSGCGDKRDGNPNDTADSAFEGTETADSGSVCMPATIRNNFEANAVLPTDCTGLKDFTPCSLVTSPDRDYDICIGGVCKSPGCGVADCNVPGPYFRLSDSGQRNCFDNAGRAYLCPMKGEPLYGQDAQYGWDPANSPDTRYGRILNDAGEPVVEDNVTGLVWQGCVAGTLTGNCATGSPRQLLWEDALAYCDSLSWGGYDDWRLPDEFALQSIMDFERAIHWDREAVFPGEPNHLVYWSSATAAGDSTQAWVVDGDEGNLGYSSKELDVNYIRCVRSGPSSGYTTRFKREESVLSEPILTDNATCLMWQGCAAGQSGGDCLTGETATMDWPAALAYCENARWGGYDDWRLPNVMEMNSIANNGAYAQTFYQTALPALNAESDSYPYETVPAWSWTSTTYKIDVNDERAWHGSFSSGEVTYNYGYSPGSARVSAGVTVGTTKMSALSVRCVRDRADIFIPTDSDSALPADTDSMTDFVDSETASGDDNCATATLPDMVDSDTESITVFKEVRGPYFPLADSGVRRCYKGAAASTNTTCPVPGEAYFGQDAQYGWDVDNDASLRYTRILETVEEPVVKDNITGLVWQGCSAGESGADCNIGKKESLSHYYNDSSYLDSDYTAPMTASAYCASLLWGGYDDWRVPDEFALQSIVDYSTANPAIDVIAFPGDAGGYYLSSNWETFPHIRCCDEYARGWQVNFSDGSIRYGDDGGNVRCVRSELSIKPSVRFQAEGRLANEPIVGDRYTGLQWQGCTAGLTGKKCWYKGAQAMTWQDALAYCENLSWGCHDDWRLPNISELYSIAQGDFQDITPPYWSSTPVNDAVGAAMTLDGSLENDQLEIAPRPGSSQPSYVRCVRNGS
ncbi:MAG: DUF1566 domain-containing protein [Deltaproteobacteria bacterium]|nr:DUF1566 domain-containing protein [Deltaproteobacteria bacterium]